MRLFADSETIFYLCVLTFKRAFMYTASIELYETLKLKIGESEAKKLVAAMDTKSNREELLQYTPKHEFKTDLKEVNAKIELTRQELLAKVDWTKADLERSIEKVNSNTIKWTFVFWIGHTITLLTLLRFLLQGMIQDAVAAAMHH